MTDPNPAPPHVPVFCCPSCRHEYDEERYIPYSLRCGCALCLPCLNQRCGAATAANATCVDGHALGGADIVKNGDVVPSRVLLQLVRDRREYCPLHPSKKIEIWCPACASGLCVTCHMGDDHMRRCASIQQLEITTPAAAEAVQRRAQEMLTNFSEAEARVANAALPPLEAYSSEALMTRMRELAVQARTAFDERLFEIVSANLELALGHQISAAYGAMEDRHQRLVLLQNATRQIQDAEALAHHEPAAAAARLRRFQVDPEIGKPLRVLPQLRMLDGIRLEVEPVWRDIPPETLNVLEDEALTSIAVTEAENHRIKILRSDGTFVRHLGSAGRPGAGDLEFAGTRGIALLGDGQTLVISEMENHRLKVLRVDGTFIGNIGNIASKAGTGDFEFNGPRGLTVLGDGGTLAVCDFGNNRIKIITSDGLFIRHIGNASCRPGAGELEFNKPIGITCLGDGLTLAVTDLENHRIKIVTADGVFMRHIGEPPRPGRTRAISELDFNIPLGIAVLGDGVTLAICDSENHRIKIVRSDDGSFVRHIGSGIPGVRAGDFHGPCGVAALHDGTTLAVTDFVNHRIKIVRSDGAFVRHIGGGYGSTRQRRRMAASGGASPATPGGGDSAGNNTTATSVTSAAANDMVYGDREPTTGSATHAGASVTASSYRTPRRGGRGEREFAGPWGICCLEFHAGSPNRSSRVNAAMFDEIGSRTPSQAVVPPATPAPAGGGAAAGAGGGGGQL